MDDSILLINKPKGITSAKIVALIKKKFGKKAGHTGTLDPSATGLLIVLLGDKTKEVSNFLTLPKVYEVEVILGISTDTYDLEGRILKKNDKKITKKDLEKVLLKFKGKIWQTPPPFSAKKVKGEEAYKLARRGEKFFLSQQEVEILNLKLLDFKYPYFKLLLKVSSGFYVRSLINDIGEILKVGAVVKEIKRLKIGDYSLENAKSLYEILNY